MIGQQHRVRDFDTWKPLFDEHGDVISEPHMTWAEETETVEY